MTCHSRASHRIPTNLFTRNTDLSSISQLSTFSEASCSIRKAFRLQTMTHLCSTAINKLKQIYYNPTATDIYQIFVFFEKMCGLRPFVIVFSDNKIRLERSRLGSAMTFLHLLIFGLCCLVFFHLNPPIVYISENTINKTESVIMTWLHLINTYVIFVQVSMEMDFS